MIHVGKGNDTAFPKRSLQVAGRPRGRPAKTVHMRQPSMVPYMDGIATL